MTDTTYHAFVDERHAICTAVGHDTRITSGVIRIDTYKDDNKVRADAYTVRDLHARVVNAKLPCNKYHWTRVCDTH